MKTNLSFLLFFVFTFANIFATQKDSTIRIKPQKSIDLFFGAGLGSSNSTENTFYTNVRPLARMGLNLRYKIIYKNRYGWSLGIGYCQAGRLMKLFADPNYPQLEIKQYTSYILCPLQFHYLFGHSKRFNIGLGFNVSKYLTRTNNAKDLNTGKVHYHEYKIPGYLNNFGYNFSANYHLLKIKGFNLGISLNGAISNTYTENYVTSFYNKYRLVNILLGMQLSYNIGK